MTSLLRSTKWLERAARIGHDLRASAFRQSGRCSWVGRSIGESASRAGAIVPTVTAIGPDLYDGTAGVALFLGQLHAVTGEEETKTIALEAIHHALDEARRSRPSLGLYKGSAGIALSAARLATLLDTPVLLERARYIVERLNHSVVLENARCDVIGGASGAILALLAWPEESARYLTLCDRLGKALVSAATRSEDSWAWSTQRAMGPTSGVETSKPLVGVSHGAAGMGLALLELHARTGNPEFAKVGRGAFGYERRVFDATERNWPDFRIRAWSPETVFSAGWCYGAPGIALTRRRALGLSEEPIWQEELDAAIAASRREALELHEPGTDTTLCHGLAGCLEPLLEAGEQEEVAQIWAPVIDAFGETNAWPSGLPSRGPNPSLMLGTAGVGYSFLRLHDPMTPSVLLPRLGQ